MNETPFPKLVRDFKIFEIFEGTNQIQREQISLQLIKEFGKGQWGNEALAEMEEAHAKAPQCGANNIGQFRRVFSEYLDYTLSSKEGLISSDQYLRFILADVLIELETAHSFTRAVSRLEENDPSRFYNLCARIYTQEVILRNAYRLRRLVLSSLGPNALETLEDKAPVRPLEAQCSTLAHDRRTLGAYLEENNI